jgi:hypothetical protein
MTVEMHHRQDKYPVGFNTIDHAIWKSAGKTAMNIALQRWPRFRIGKDVLNRHMDFNGKVLAKAGFAFFVVINCPVKLCLGCRME